MNLELSRPIAEVSNTIFNSTGIFGPQSIKDNPNLVMVYFEMSNILIRRISDMYLRAFPYSTASSLTAEGVGGAGVAGGTEISASVT